MFEAKNNNKEEVNLIVELEGDFRPGKFWELLTKAYALESILKIDMKILIFTASRNSPPVLLDESFITREPEKLVAQC